MFTINHLLWPIDDSDQTFKRLEDAECQAIDESFDDSPWGVFDDNRDLVSIVFQQEVFSK